MAPYGWPSDPEEAFLVGRTVRGLLWRVLASVLLPAAWISATLVYLDFWAHGLDLAQVVVVGIVSALTLVAALTALWVAFGFRLKRLWVDG